MRAQISLLNNFLSPSTSSASSSSSPSSWSLSRCVLHVTWTACRHCRFLGLHNCRINLALWLSECYSYKHSILWTMSVYNWCEILYIVGTGKTTFIRMLAGKLPSDGNGKYSVPSSICEKVYMVKETDYSFAACMRQKKFSHPSGVELGRSLHSDTLLSHCRKLIHKLGRGACLSQTDRA